MPALVVTVLVDAASGELHVLDPPGWRSGLPYPKLRDESIRFRAEVMEPGDDSNQTGFELPSTPPEDPLGNKASLATELCAAHKVAR